MTKENIQHDIRNWTPTAQYFVTFINSRQEQATLTFSNYISALNHAMFVGLHQTVRIHN